MTNSSGKLNGEPKWLVPPLTSSSFEMSQFSFCDPSPTMPGPEASTEYQLLATLALLDFAR